jgi:phage replication O-like protein O
MSATPQLEDGFVRIANELLEAILAGSFTQRELLVLLAIVRKTYGYSKKEDDLSASQIGDLCGVARPHVTSTLNALAQRNVITKRPGRFGSMIGIQKNHAKWISAGQLKTAPASTELVHPCTESVHVPNRYGGSTESVQVDSTDSVHTKDNLPKDNHQKKSSCALAVGQQDGKSEHHAADSTAPAPKRRKADEMKARFERFYEAYPRKKSRMDAVRAFTKLNPDEDLLERILASLEHVKASGEWSDPKYIPYPASWLNGGGWLDEVQAAYSPDQVAVIEAFNDTLGAQLGDVSATIFVAARAAAITEFVTFSTKDEFAKRYFLWLRDQNQLPPKIGFDRLIGRQGYSDAIGGKFTRKAA